MKKYLAYTQKGFNEEKFYIEDEEGSKLIITAENDEEAEEKFINYIYETSLYSDDETAEWIRNNPLFIMVKE